MATVGDEQPVRVAEREQVRAAQGDPNPRAALERSIVYAADLLERAGDLIMVSVEAAGADADMRAAADAGARATHEVHLTLATRLAEQGALRRGLDAATAALVSVLVGAAALIGLMLFVVARRSRSRSTLNPAEDVHRDFTPGSEIHPSVFDSKNGNV